MSDAVITRALADAAWGFRAGHEMMEVSLRLSVGQRQETRRRGGEAEEGRWLECAPTSTLRALWPDRIDPDTNELMPGLQPPGKRRTHRPDGR
jgi:hypothetical protein